MTEEAFERAYETARALGEETRFRIYRRLCLTHEPTSVSDLARTFSLHPNAIRQHLARLEQAGLVISRPHREGGAGRPRRMYRANPEPLQFGAPAQPMAALIEPLEDALKLLPDDRELLVAFGRAWGVAWAGRRKGENGLPRGRRGQAELLAGELAMWGWAPSTRQDDGQFRLATGRCLFRGGPPGRNELGCAVEEGLLAGLVEGLLQAPAESTVEGCALEVSI